VTQKSCDNTHSAEEVINGSANPAVDLSTSDTVNGDNATLNKFAETCHSIAFKQEQFSNSALTFAFRLARSNCSGYSIHNDLLFRNEKLYGRSYFNLVVPTTR
jgi:hypothetical protein